MWAPMTCFYTGARNPNFHTYAYPESTLPIESSCYHPPLVLLLKTLILLSNSSSLKGGVWTVSHTGRLVKYPSDANLIPHQKDTVRQPWCTLLRTIKHELYALMMLQSRQTNHLSINPYRPDMELEIPLHTLGMKQKLGVIFLSKHI